MCMNCKVNVQSTDEFGERLIDMMNSGSLCLMISIGHRTGLFDTMAELKNPATSNEIAEAAGLNERYVREWLGAMTVGNIVICDPDGPRYSFPEKYASLLTSDAGADNIAVLTQYFSILGGVEDSIVKCFENGGGVPYSEYKRFHEVMESDSGQWGVAPLFDHILPLVKGIEKKLETGIDVLDAGCGRGRAVVLMAQAFPRSRFTGYDLSDEAIQYARNLAAEMGVTNVRFEQRDLTTFNNDAEPEAFDFITTFDAVHDQARPDNLLSGINKSLRTDGVYLMIDIAASSNVYENSDHPIGPLLYTISTMHCMTVSLASGGMGLGTMWGRQKAIEMLRDAGFTRIEIESLAHDIQNNYYIMRK